ncbi:hypothetical protein CU097_003704, partial [Rhizopus azygosporus]
NVKEWLNFLKTEAHEKRISYSVFRISQHYLCHIPYMIKAMGPLRAYSFRPMERAFGAISTLIKSKVEAGINASNVVERLALRRYVDFYSDIQQELDPIRPRPAPQYWEPFRCGVVATECNVSSDNWSIPTDTLYSCLQQFYRHTLNGEESRSPIDINIDIAARAWINSTVYSSVYYRNYRQEFRRSNHIVKFYGYNNKFNNFAVCIIFELVIVGFFVIEIAVYVGIIVVNVEE